VADEPTLAKGMESADGWVEYLQQLLQHHLGETELPVNGLFDELTHELVIRFQREKSLEPVDGVVGDATWSALRNQPERAAAGDSGAGRDYLEKGVELRFAPDAVYTGTANGVDDAVVLTAYSVGTVDPQLEAVHVVTHVSDAEGGSREMASTLHYYDSTRELQIVVGDVSQGKPNGRYSILAQLSVDGEPGAEDSVQAEFDVLK
jgi:peptidoglycan hydrolase-like protein with peptidoglycan-binding domain